MSKRTAMKWLSIESLRDEGLREQWMAERWPHRHSVSLMYDHARPHVPFLVHYEITKRNGDLIESHGKWFERVDDARAFFNQQIRKAKA